MLQKNLDNFSFNNKIYLYIYYFYLKFGVQLHYSYITIHCLTIYIRFYKRQKYFLQKKKKKNYIFNKKFGLIKGKSIIINAIVTNFFFRRKKKYKRFKNATHSLYIIKRYFQKRQKLKYVTYSKIFSYPCLSLRSNNYKTFTLKQRHFLLKNVLMRRLFAFLLSNNKTTKIFLNYKFFKKKKVFLANMHKKLAWKMHKARIIHWNFTTHGQLNKYRYNKLLAHTLIFLKKNSSVTFLIFLLFSFYTFVSSYKQIFLLFKNNLIIWNGNYIYDNITLKIGDIIELPFGVSLAKARKDATRYFRLKKLKRLTYKFFKKHNHDKKKIPKIYKKAIFTTQTKKNYLAYDPTLNIIAIIDKIPRFNYNVRQQLLKSSVIGLQNWRYEFQ